MQCHDFSSIKHPGWQAVKDDKEEDVKEWLRLKKKVKFHDKHGFAPVHYAAKLNRLEILKHLHREGKAGK